MKRIHKMIIVRVALFASLLLAGCVSITLTPIDLTGTWTGTLTWVGGPASGLTYPLTLAVVDAEGVLSGTATLMGPGSQPFDLTITDGEAKGRSLTVVASGTLTLITPPIAVSVHLDGDFEEMLMSGTGTQTADGQTYEFTWQLQRITPIPEA